MKKLELDYLPVRETKTCRVYQHGEKGSTEYQTLYVKKEQLEESGIPSGHTIRVTIEEA